MTRRIAYVSGTRADFGLMRATLDRVERHPDLALMLLVTGMHLDSRYGETVREIEQAGFRIADRIPADMRTNSGAEMARGIAAMVAGFTATLEREQPDLTLLLGDRGEMLAGAIAAIHLNIPVAHIHGGERSGTVDEPVRHAISKLSHYHFTATEEARERLIRMGEDEARIFVTGAPGIVGLEAVPRRSRAELARDAGLDPDRPIALMVFHPVLQDAEDAGAETATLLRVLERKGLQVIALLPNADAGSQHIRVLLEQHRDRAWIKVMTHLPRPEFVEWMAAANVMIGNSSSGIIEAATFGTPVVNIGTRQYLRERNANVIDVDASETAIDEGVDRALALGHRPPANIYGDGQADVRIADLLASVPLDRHVLRKFNAY